MLKHLVIAIGLILMTACQSIPTPKQGDTINTATTQTQLHPPISNEQNIYDYTLDNGLRVIIKPQKSPLVMTQIWYKVGSNNEYVGIGGISHFLEHMMFKESAGIDGAVYDKVVSHFGGSRNAFTSNDYTSYYQLLPANQYPLGLEIEANRMRGLVFDQDKFDKEKEVVKEERRLRTDDNPISKAYEELLPKLYDNNKARPVIGYMNEIDGITLPQMKTWYDAYYHPNYATLVIVGGVQVDEAKAWVEKYFAHIPKEVLDKKPSTPPPNLHQKSHRGYQEIITYQKVTVPSLILAFNVPTLNTAKNPKEAYGLGLFADMADGGQSARFAKNLVRGKQLLTSVGIDYSFYGIGDDVLTIFATPREGVDLQEAKTAILQELNTLMNDEISPSELKRGQVALKAGLILKNDSIRGQASSLGTLAMLGLPLDSFEQLPQVLESISVEDIQSSAKKYLTDDNMTVMYILPESTKNTPAKKSVHKAIKKPTKKSKK